MICDCQNKFDDVVCKLSALQAMLEPGEGKIDGAAKAGLAMIIGEIMNRILDISENLEVTPIEQDECG